LLTVRLNEEPRLSNFALDRYCSILPVKGIYSNASYGAYPSTDDEWEEIGLTREKTAKKFLLRVVEMMIERGIPAEAAAVKSLHAIAELLDSFPRFGDFKSGQFALDLNYGPHLRLPVGNFVIAGPGARNGINRCFVAHGKRYNEVIRLVCQYQDECSLAAVSSNVPQLQSRAPAPMTVQNWFCEIGKYLRGENMDNYSVPAGMIKPLPEPDLPPWWCATK
jgi:hypothetical protein